MFVLTVIALAQELTGVDPSPRPAVEVCITGVMGVMSALVAAYLTLFYRRGRLFVSDDQVRLVMVFRDRTVRVANVTSAQWTLIPAGGNLVLRSEPHGKVRIGLSEFERKRELARLLRKTIPEQIQTGFHAFEQVHLINLQILQVEMSRLKRRALLYSVIGYAVFEPIFIGLKVKGLLPDMPWWQVLIMPTCGILFWLYLWVEGRPDRAEHG